jgi:hypothetical protein
VLAPKQNLPADQRRLLKLYAGLAERDRENLFAFAEFLASRNEESSEVMQSVDPVVIPRPRQESVIAAIKRLSKTYHMLDRSTMLTETSSLMTAHVMHGKQAQEVIDELESLFADNYRQYRENSP